jgi:DNA-binding transcriptional MerR regulator
METNVKGAGITLEKVKSSIKELQTLSQTAKGVAKKELTKVIKKKQERVTELEKHLKEGNLLIADKKKSKAQTPKDAAPQAS